MKTSKEIIKWLQANLGGRHATAGLTSTDTHALVTATNLSNLISYESAPARLFQAYGAIVEEMQPTTRHLAFHAIACELDWSHRMMIWTRAGLTDGRGRGPAIRCLCEPREYPPMANETLPAAA